MECIAADSCLSGGRKWIISDVNDCYISGIIVRKNHFLYNIGCTCNRLKSKTFQPASVYSKRRSCFGKCIFVMKKSKKRKAEFPKINSIDYGGKWILTGLLAGVVLPAAVWFIFHIFVGEMCIIGAGIIVAFILLFIIETHQDNGRIPYYEKELKEKFPFDKETQYAVMHVSICTGEKVAGFKNFSDSHFTEVMVIKTEEDLERFKKIYDLEDMKKEY